MEGPIVTVTQGKLRGSVAEDIDGHPYYSFKGIPYAQPLSGSLRFKAPLPPLPWKGILEATTDGSCCPSIDLFTKKIVGSDDCLNLSVYTPQLPSKNEELLPVMLWIHGGGFICGSNNSSFYGPEFLVSANVVVVTINYRLGLLGFLSLKNPSLKVPGNAGFKDMVMALKWVQNNIKAFSGDPDNVTVFGESAGGAAAHLLMLSPMSKGLFHKVIAQSGCALSLWSKGKQCDEEIFKAFGYLGKSEEELLSHLQNLPLKTLIECQSKIDYFLDANKFGPYGFVVEAECDEAAFLTEEPIDIILSGKYLNVPLILGCTNLEGSVIHTYNPKRYINMLHDFETRVPYNIGCKQGSDESKLLGQKIKEYYDLNDYPNEDNEYKFYEFVTDCLFLYGVYSSATKHAQSSSAPVYFYRFSLESSLGFLKKLMVKPVQGVPHGEDVPYIFKNIFTPSLAADSLEYLSIKKVVKLWTNFARYGNPTVEEGILKWKRFTTNGRWFLDIDKELTLGDSSNNRNLIFWDSIYSGTSAGNKFSKI